MSLSKEFIAALAAERERLEDIEEKARVASNRGYDKQREANKALHVLGNIETAANDWEDWDV